MKSRSLEKYFRSFIVIALTAAITSCGSKKANPRSSDGQSTPPATVYTLSYPTLAPYYEMDNGVNDSTVDAAVSSNADLAQLSNFKVTPNLPGGVFLDPSTGKISGTPVGEWLPEQFTITADRAGGAKISGTVTFGVHKVGETAVDASSTTPRNFTYENVDFVAYVGENIAPISPRYVGEPNLSYTSVNPLPYGMTLDPATGVITGSTPYEDEYTLKIGVQEGFETYYTVIKIHSKLPPLVNMAYSVNPAVYPRNDYIIIWPVFDRGVADSFSVSPALPAGLTLNPSNGQISGSCSALQAPTEYTVTATNTINSVSAKVTIEIADRAPENLSYTKNSPRYVQGHPINDNVPTVGYSGGAVASYSVSPALPAGLSLNTSTGLITGSPTTLQASADYVVTASNSTGSTTRTLSIAVVPPGTSTLYTGDGVSLKAYSVDDVNGDPTYLGKTISSAVKSKLVFHPTHDCMAGYTGTSVESFSVNKAAQGELTLATSVGGVSSPGGIAQTADGDYIFIANSGYVSTYSIDASCALTFIGNVSAGNNPIGAVVSGANVYVANASGVQHFRHNGSGTLTYTSAAGSGNAKTLAIHPSGSHLYVTFDRTSETLAADASTGALSFARSDYYQDWYHIRTGWFIDGFFIHPMQAQYGDGLVSYKMVPGGLEVKQTRFGQSEVGEGYAGAWEVTAHKSPSGTYIYANYRNVARWGARRLKLDTTDGTMSIVDSSIMNVIGGY